MKKVFFFVGVLGSLCSSVVAYSTSANNIQVISIGADRASGKFIVKFPPGTFPQCNDEAYGTANSQLSQLLTAKSTGEYLQYIIISQVSNIQVGPELLGCQIEYVEY